MEKAAETNDSTSQNTLRKGTLPPADIVFDHIDRVSQRFHKVKTKLAHEESICNASFVSKGSFRQHSSKKKVRDEAQKVEPARLLRKGTFDTDQDSDAYMEEIDQMIKREQERAVPQFAKAKPHFAQIKIEEEEEPKRTSPTPDFEKESIRIKPVSDSKHF